MTSLPAPRPRNTTPPEGPLGVLQAVLFLAALLVLCGALAWGISNLLGGVFPTLPAYTLLILFGLLLVPGATLLLRAVPWLQGWYYLLPSVVFLMAFTVLPIVLTVNYAFTNYSSQNSGQPDAALKTPITLAADRRSVTFGELPSDTPDVASFLGCSQSSCAGDTIVLYDEGGSVPVRYRVQAVEGRTVQLANVIPDTFVPTDATRLNRISRVGLRQFQDIFGRATSDLAPIFTWTIVFAFMTQILNLFAGLVLGIMLYNKRLKFRNFYRTLLFLPWAIPMIISAQVWGGLLNVQFGAINKMLGLIGITSIPWLLDPLWAKIAILMVNLWLSFPYMMTATINALSTISDDLYEAASIDGASRWDQIRHITLPLIRTAFTPILLSGFAFNFNNFGVIYLLTLTAPGGAGGPPVEGQSSTAGATDILISWGYKTAFSSQGGGNYAMASAIALIVFFLTLAISLVNFRASGVFKEASRDR